MTRERILTEIRRTAAANGGQPLGKARFLAETGIKEADWSGRFWVRWNDAVREAGFEPNGLNSALPSPKMLTKLSAFIAELGHFPVEAELRLKRRADPGFPSSGTFARFGTKTGLVAACREFAEKRGDLAVAAICAAHEARSVQTVGCGSDSGEDAVGYVYLLKHGSRRQYKIGRTNNPIRREGEVAGALPEQLMPVHTIATDDPSGVESYWHRRFASKRLQNEWFELTPSDVRAFRRWRRIY